MICQDVSGNMWCCQTPILKGLDRGTTKSFNGDDLGSCNGFVIKPAHAVVTKFEHVTENGWKGSNVDIKLLGDTNQNEIVYGCPITTWLDTPATAEVPSEATVTCTS